MRKPSQQSFRTRREVERYFSGATIKCLLCGKRYRRLAFHLAAKHAMTADEYKGRFGLPWSRGLISAESLAKSGWDDDRKANARRLARKTKFFTFARRTERRREVAPFLKAEALKHLGAHAVGFGSKFELRVSKLFRRGLTDAAIAKILNVNRATVNQRTRKWRKLKRGRGLRRHVN